MAERKWAGKGSARPPKGMSREEAQRLIDEADAQRAREEAEKS